MYVRVLCTCVINNRGDIQTFCKNGPSVCFYIPSTMTDLNLIIFVFDYTLILRLASGHYITKLTKTTLKKRVRKIICLCSCNGMLK